MFLLLLIFYEFDPQKKHDEKLAKKIPFDQDWKVQMSLTNDIFQTSSCPRSIFFPIYIQLLKQIFQSMFYLNKEIKFSLYY